MSVENDSLSSAMDAAAKDIPDAAPVTLDVPEPANTAAAEVVAETPWEAPGWSKRWKEPSRQALEALYKHPEARTHLDPLLKELDETYGYIGKQNNEYANYRKQLDPIAEVIGPYVQQYQLQGMTPQQGLQQLLATADSLRQNPDATFPWLASMYKPRDAGQAIQALAQAWGADLGALTQEQPYVDPTIKTMLGQYQSELGQLRNAMWQQQQGQVQAQQAAVLNEIEAFESATDANGAPKHPHFREVFDDMVKVVTLGHARNVNDAYDMAVRFNPKLSASMAEKQAIEAAARQTADAKHAADASRNVSGKPNGRDTAPSTIEEAMKAAERELARA